MKMSKVWNVSENEKWKARNNENKSMKWRNERRKYWSFWKEMAAESLSKNLCIEAEKIEENDSENVKEEEECRRKANEWNG